ncbi:MAG TPA: hypothetical protein VGP82_09070 [Ktedonobacterales bacterium]|jgi:hypothetical protein|nr:hypothetical protein [Ktedonobacterales bacterium]
MKRAASSRLAGRLLLEHQPLAHPSSYQPAAPARGRRAARRRPSQRLTQLLLLLAVEQRRLPVGGNRARLRMPSQTFGVIASGQLANAIGRVARTLRGSLGGLTMREQP